MGIKVGNWKIVVVLVVSTFVASGCFAGTDAYSAAEPANFLWGIWHGWTAPLAIILHFFDDQVRIYEPDNTGILYDIGFYMAIISGFGSLGLSRRKIKRNRR